MRSGNAVRSRSSAPAGTRTSRPASPTRGNPYVAVRARNVSDVALDVALVTGAGEKTFAAVAAGANAYQSFAVRGVEAGADVPVAVTATGPGGATQEVARDVAVPSCG